MRASLFRPSRLLLLVLPIVIAPCCKRDGAADTGKQREPAEQWRTPGTAPPAGMESADNDRTIWDGLRSGNDLPAAIEALDARWPELDRSTRDTAKEMAASHLGNQLGDTDPGYVRELQTEELAAHLSVAVAKAMLETHPHQAVEFILGIHHAQVRSQVTEEVAAHWAGTLASAADRTPIRAAIEWLRREPLPGVKEIIWTHLNRPSHAWDYGAQVEWDKLGKEYGFRK